MGEHGDSEFAAYDEATIGSKPLRAIAKKTAFQMMNYLS